MAGCGGSAGGVGGVLGAALALLFFALHRALKKASVAIGLHEHKTPVLSGACLFVFRCTVGCGVYSEQPCHVMCCCVV